MSRNHPFPSNVASGPEGPTAPLAAVGIAPDSRHHHHVGIDHLLATRRGRYWGAVGHEHRAFADLTQNSLGSRRRARHVTGVGVDLRSLGVLKVRMTGQLFASDIEGRADEMAAGGLMGVALSRSEDFYALLQISRRHLIFLHRRANWEPWMTGDPMP